MEYVGKKSNKEASANSGYLLFLSLHSPILQKIRPIRSVRRKSIRLRAWMIPDSLKILNPLKIPDPLKILILLISASFLSVLPA